MTYKPKGAEHHVARMWVDKVMEKYDTKYITDIIEGDLTKIERDMLLKELKKLAIKFHIISKGQNEIL